MLPAGAGGEENRVSEKSAIAWTDATWNPFYGCHKVSPGCAHCYMDRWADRAGQDADLVKRAAPTTFNAPLRWRGPRLVFTCSLSDFFIAEADPWRPEVWDIIRRTPHLTYQILTKRPERIADHLPADWGEGWSNVWLGVSVESDRWRSRINELFAVPAALYFVSAEPLLGLVDLSGYLAGGEYCANCGDGSPFGICCEEPIRVEAPRLDWVIAGGESGPGCRPMHLEWVRSLRNQCQRNDVSFFLKQLGGWPDQRTHERAVLDGHTWTEMPTMRAGQMAMALS